MGKLLEDADFEADVTSWAAADGGRLLLNLPEGSYTYRTWYGRVGTGSLEHDDEDLVLIYGDLDGENDYYLLEDAGGLMPYHVNGESGGEWGELNERHFDPAAEEMAAFDRSVLDGEWQNARGYSFVFDTAAMKVAESDPIGVMSSGDMYDKEDGRALPRWCRDPLPVPQRGRQQLRALPGWWRGARYGCAEHRRVLPERGDGAVCGSGQCRFPGSGWPSLVQRWRPRVRGAGRIHPGGRWHGL